LVADLKIKTKCGVMSTFIEPPCESALCVNQVLFPNQIRAPPVYELTGNFKSTNPRCPITRHDLGWNHDDNNKLRSETNHYKLKDHCDSSQYYHNYFKDNTNAATHADTFSDKCDNTYDLNSKCCFTITGPGAESYSDPLWPTEDPEGYEYKIIATAKGGLTHEVTGEKDHLNDC
jgi:hypothetical protein